ncbi:MAG: YbaN family protein [Pseudomonadota bacterium]
MRLIWVIAGWAAFGLGLIGAALPLLPTVPFMLLAAFCFARGSERFHRWLVQHPRFGPAIQNWRAHGAISRRAKLMAIFALSAALALSLIMAVKPLVIGIQAVVMACVLVFILTRPDGPAEE